MTGIVWPGFGQGDWGGVVYVREPDGVSTSSKDCRSGMPRSGTNGEARQSADEAENIMLHLRSSR